MFMIGDYSKYALRGVIAGIMTGISLCFILMLTLPAVGDLVNYLLKYQLSKQLPPDKIEEILKTVKPTIDTVLMIAPIAQIFEYLVFGSIFGILQGFYRLRLKLGELGSALASGITFMLTLGVLPLITMVLVFQDVFDMLAARSEYLLIILPLGQGIMFTAFLVLMSFNIKVFNRFVDAKPKET
ncbi:MAG: hypothetical protein RMH77_03020 [Sulfolobales archaeon]|nr:hypothetical protein [Sulfolobales archaeon]MCX8186067.1 hypothetical protein [Sulfolobales archaeon]MDW7969362.1 hypothetical protein [Sulfolobales archaeon]